VDVTITQVSGYKGTIMAATLFKDTTAATWKNTAAVSWQKPAIPIELGDVLHAHTTDLDMSG